MNTKIIAIALVFLIVGLVLGYAITFSLWSQQLADLKEKMKTLENSYNSLKEEYSSLQSKYSNLESKNRELAEILNNVKKENEELKNNYTILKKKYNDLMNELNDYISKYESLKEEYDNLSSYCSDLEETLSEAGIGGLSLTPIYFYSGEPPNASIKEPPEYNPGEKVWMYVELSGFSIALTDNNKYVVDVEWYLQIYDDFGNQVLTYGPIEFYKEYSSENEVPDVLWFKPYVILNTPGAYIAVVTAYDKVSLRTYSVANVFFIKPSETPPLP